MDTDGSRSINEKQENDHNDHKVGKVLLAPLIWLNKGLMALLKSVLGAKTLRRTRCATLWTR